MLPSPLSLIHIFPVRLPCYDFTPLTLHTFGASPLAVGPADVYKRQGVDGVTQHESGLGHGALKSVDEQQRAVGQAQHALDLAAEVGVAGRIDDVDLHAVVVDGDILSQNSDAALALLVVGVEHAVLDLSLIHILGSPVSMGPPSAAAQ